MNLSSCARYLINDADRQQSDFSQPFFTYKNHLGKPINIPLVKYLLLLAMFILSHTLSAQLAEKHTTQISYLKMMQRENRKYKTGGIGFTDGFSKDTAQVLCEGKTLYSKIIRSSNFSACWAGFLELKLNRLYVLKVNKLYTAYLYVDQEYPFIEVRFNRDDNILFIDYSDIPLQLE